MTVMSTIPQATGRRGVKLDDLSNLTALTETTRNPEMYDALRREWGTVAPVELQPGVKGWIVMGYTEICEMTRNDHVFSRQGTNWSAFADGRITTSSPYFTWAMPRQNAVHKDGEERRRLREPVDQGIASTDESALAAHVREVCEGFVARMAPNGRADLVSEYASVVPLLAVAHMLGLDPKTAEVMAGYARKIIASQAASDAATALADLQDLITKHINKRRADPARDVTTSFLNNRLLSSDEEIREALSITIIGGYEMTETLITKSLLLMLSDRRFSGRLRGGRMNVHDAIEEVLWRDPPAYNAIPRFAKRDTMLGGQKIRRGDCLLPALYAANRDPVMTGGDPWSEVGNRAHLAWGTGRHRCPAQRPARIIVSTAVQVALDGLRDLALAVPVDQLPRVQESIASNYPTALPVTFTPPRQLQTTAPGRRRAGR